MNLTKLYTIIKEKLDIFYIPFFSFFGVFLWSVISTHFINMYNTGYLNHFKIYTSYKIETTMSHSRLTLLIIFTLFIILFVILSYFMNHYLYYRKLIKNDNKVLKVTVKIFIILFYYLATHLLLTIMFSYIICIANMNIFGVMFGKIIIYKEIFLFTILLTGLVFAVCGIMFFLLSKMENSVKDESTPNKTKDNTETKKSWKIFEKTNKEKSNTLTSNLIFLLITIAILIFIYIMDSFTYSLGEINANLEIKLPTFNENKEEFVVVAKVEGNSYLVIEIDSLTKGNPVYTFKNLNGYKLKDKRNNYIK